MEPNQAEFLRGFLLPQLKSEQAVTVGIMSAIPADKSGYKPHAKGMSAVQLAWHLADCELWFLDAIVRGHFKETPPRPAETMACSDVAQWYGENFAQRMPMLEALSGEQLVKPIDYFGLRNDAAVAYINIAIRHSVHHRGQLSTYLRAMDEKVPAIYVESADEPYAGDGSDTRRPPAF